jgi:hypothetical protein
VERNHEEKVADFTGAVVLLLSVADLHGAGSWKMKSNLDAVGR